MLAIKKFILLLCLITSSVTNAGIISFHDSTAFYSHMNSNGLLSNIESFEGFAPGTSISSGSSLNGITYGFSSQGIQLMVTDHFFTTDGNNALGTTSGSAFLDYYDSLELSFGLTQAVGMHLILTDVALDAELFLTIGNDIVPIVSNAYEVLADGGLSYFIGAVSTMHFSSIKLMSSNDGSANFEYTIDEISWAKVPEPTSILLLVIGIFFIISGKKTLIMERAMKWELSKLASIFVATSLFVVPVHAQDRPTVTGNAERILELESLFFSIQEDILLLQSQLEALNEQLNTVGGGVSGNWIDMTSNRSFNTIYSNVTDSTMVVALQILRAGSNEGQDVVSLQVRSNEDATFYTVDLGRVSSRFNDQSDSVSALIPAGYQYRAIRANNRAALTQWMELQHN